MSMQEAQETFGTMLRWAEQPKDQAQAEKTVFKGTSVQGFYVAKRDGVGQNDSTVYEILTAEGEKLSFWGSGLLDGKFDQIPLNCEVRVTCLGTAQPKTAGGRPYLNFKVEFDKDSVKPANLVEATNGGVASAAPTSPAAAAPVAPAQGVTAPAAPAAPAAATPTQPVEGQPPAAQGDGF